MGLRPRVPIPEREITDILARRISVLLRTEVPPVRPDPTIELFRREGIRAFSVVPIEPQTNLRLLLWRESEAFRGSPARLEELVADALPRLRNLPLYHATPMENIRSIERSGLLPAAELRRVARLGSLSMPPTSRLDIQMNLDRFTFFTRGPVPSGAYGPVTLVVHPRVMKEGTFFASADLVMTHTRLWGVLGREPTEAELMTQWGATVLTSPDDATLFWATSFVARRQWPWDYEWHILGEVAPDDILFVTTINTDPQAFLGSFRGTGMLPRRFEFFLPKSELLEEQAAEIEAEAVRRITPSPQ